MAAMLFRVYKQFSEIPRVLWLIAAAPVILALSTWSYDTSDPVWMKCFRGYSIPILVVELLVIVCSIAGRSGPTEVFKRLSPWVKAAVAVLFVISLDTALLVAPFQELSIIQTDFWFIHFIFGLSVAALAGSRLRLGPADLWTPIVIGLAGYVLVIVLFLVLMPDPANFNWRPFYLGVTNIRQTGPYSTVGYCAAIAIAAISRSRMGYLVALVCATAMIGLSFWSGTRGAILSSAFSLGLGMVFIKVLRTKKAIYALLLSILGGFILSTVYIPPDPAFGPWRIYFATVQDSADGITSGRISLWKEGVAKIGERPWFGYGVGQYRYVVPEALNRVNHLHNSVLQIAFDWGIVGAILFFLLVGLMWVGLLKRVVIRPEQHICPFLIVNAILSLSMIDETLYHPYPIMMLAFAMAAGL